MIALLHPVRRCIGGTLGEAACSLPSFYWGMPWGIYESPRGCSCSLIWCGWIQWSTIYDRGPIASMTINLHHQATSNSSMPPIISYLVGCLYCIPLVFLLVIVIFLVLYTISFRKKSHDYRTTHNQPEITITDHRSDAFLPTGTAPTTGLGLRGLHRNPNLPRELRGRRHSRQSETEPRQRGRCSRGDGVHHEDDGLLMLIESWLFDGWWWVIMDKWWFMMLFHHGWSRLQ